MTREFNARKAYDARAKHAICEMDFDESPYLAVTLMADRSENSETTCLIDSAAIPSIVA